MQILALQWRRSNRRVGFVPTMGYLHEGHASLIRRARKEVGPKGVVVVSLYVNPTQFAAHEDLGRYPRDFAGDRATCQRSGADILFFPTDAQMYPNRDRGDYSTYVLEEKLSRPMEGESRPEHFRGVTTIVAKLFHLVLPDVAIFGAKDFQQAAVIRKMVRDLNFPLRMIVAPTVRETDGLAMSSRNAYLTPAQREQATCLIQAIRQAKRRVGSSKNQISASTLEKELQIEIQKQPEARVDYIRFFDPTTLAPAEKVERGTHMALAVFVGKTRLIDNARL